jgi:hypothetical protein
MSKPTLNVIYAWGYLAVTKDTSGMNPAAPLPLPAIAAGLIAGYWFAGGIPADLMSAAQAYLVGGVAVYAVAYIPMA